MKLVFYNPAITGALPLWACVYNTGRWRFSEKPVCFTETVKSLLMYNETGALHLLPVQDLNNNQTPGARTGKPKREKK